eukprot:TRINITY_DN45248_c0_g1_i1.p1 TRINITY_DN45248_c0_g1~~TRINITY_DN45248_c0_g1_i1.p1  ORF type:complete len:425 (-),score=54.48 TRINITY_DN45248_c0_g1_i1:151-1284(-)
MSEAAARSRIVPNKSDLAKLLGESAGITSASAPNQVGFAIVGLGRAGSFHRAALHQLPDLARLLWVVDVDEAKVKCVAEAECCRGTTDIQDVVKDPEVQAVVVASTTNTHYQFCLAALEAGKAVFTEKPVSHDPAQLKHILDLAVAKKLPFIVGYQRRVDKNFRELQRQVVQELAVGKLRHIKCTSRDNPLPPLEYLRVSGGIFHDMLCHDFDMINFLSNEWPEVIHAFGHCHDERIQEMDDIDMVSVHMKFASGLLASVDCSRIAEYGYDQRVEVLGETGMATAHNEQTNTVVIATSRGFMHPTTQHSFPQRYEHTYATEVAEFVALVRAKGHEPEGLTMRHAMTDAVTTAAELSWRLGRSVKISEVDSLRHHLKH